MLNIPVPENKTLSYICKKYGQSVHLQKSKQNKAKQNLMKQSNEMVLFSSQFFLQAYFFPLTFPELKKCSF